MDNDTARETLALIREQGIIAIMRRLPRESLIRTAEALIKGGVRLIEVTFDQQGSINDTAEEIAALNAEFGGSACIGAGTVLTYPQLAAAREAGARYIISPDTNEDIVLATKKAGLVSMPGALTPTEVTHAHELGADMIKIFPAGQFGPGYFKALKAPLSHISLAAVGGVSYGDIGAFVKAGAEAFGISSGLFPAGAIEHRAYGEVLSMAQRYSAAFKEAVR